MDFSAALFVPWVCGKGVWRKQLDQGTSALPFPPAVARPAWLLLEDFLRAGLPCAERHVQHCVLAPLAVGEVPATTFEAVCRRRFPYAVSELNPDGPFLTASLRPPSLLSPCLKHLSDVLLLNRFVSLRILECLPALHMLPSSALPASSCPSLVQLL